MASSSLFVMNAEARAEFEKLDESQKEEALAWITRMLDVSKMLHSGLDGSYWTPKKLEDSSPAAAAAADPATAEAKSPSKGDLEKIEDSSKKLEDSSKKLEDSSPAAAAAADPATAEANSSSKGDLEITIDNGKLTGTKGDDSITVDGKSFSITNQGVTAGADSDAASLEWSDAERGTHSIKYEYAGNVTLSYSTAPLKLGDHTYKFSLEAKLPLLGTPSLVFKGSQDTEKNVDEIIVSKDFKKLTKTEPSPPHIIFKSPDFELQPLVPVHIFSAFSAFTFGVVAKLEQDATATCDKNAVEGREEPGIKLNLTNSLTLTLKPRFPIEQVYEYLKEASDAAKKTAIATKIAVLIQNMDKVVDTLKSMKHAIKDIPKYTQKLANVARKTASAVHAAKSVLSGAYKTAKAAAKVVAKQSTKLLEKIAAKKIAKEAAIQAVKKSTSKLAGKLVAKEAGKTALKAAVKSATAAGKGAAKKIPIIGFFAGLGFGIARLVQGDFAGAALEVASGTASTLPGPGTAISLLIDGGLIAKDIVEAKNKADREYQAAEEDLARDQSESEKLSDNIAFLEKQKSEIDQHKPDGTSYTDDEVDLMRKLEEKLPEIQQILDAISTSA